MLRADAVKRRQQETRLGLRILLIEDEAATARTLALRTPVQAQQQRFGNTAAPITEVVGVVPATSWTAHANDRSQSTKARRYQIRLKGGVDLVAYRVFNSTRIAMRKLRRCPTRAVYKRVTFPLIYPGREHESGNGWLHVNHLLAFAFCILR
jgi:hypothetical protein